MKIREIEACSLYYIPLLYGAARKVFGIPPWDTITKALEGDFAPLKSYLAEVAENLKGTPFSPPRVWQQIMNGTLMIWTDGGREIQVGTQFASVDFVRDGEGSVVAAGEVIAHLQEALDTSQLTRNGVSLEVEDNGEGRTIALRDYAGPVHPKLSRVTYDSEFVLTHPALTVACAQEGQTYGITLAACSLEGYADQVEGWISDSTYSVPVLASCAFGDTQELIKGNALEVAEQLAGKGLIAPELVPELVEEIAADIDKPETNTLRFGDLEVTVVDTHIA